MGLSKIARSLALLGASSSIVPWTFAAVAVGPQLYGRTSDATPLLRQRAGLTVSQMDGLRKMTKHLKRIDEGVDEDTDDYYLGYKGSDANTPWGKYLDTSPPVLSAEFSYGLNASPHPAGTGLNIQQAASAMSQPGYLELENGYTINEDGSMMLAIRTEQPPNLTGEQIDFWFSWHINDTTKYKLWNPGQHQYAAVDNHYIANATTSQPYRERYWGVTSFVDEYIGDTAYKLSIAFFDPRILNFTLEDSSKGIETIVMGFVDLFRYTEEEPTSNAEDGPGGTQVVLAHQIRKKPDGSGMEMRSRFFFGNLITTGMRLINMTDQLAHDLSVHCFNEMSHMSYLPALFEEFRNDIPTGI